MRCRSCHGVWLPLLSATLVQGTLGDGLSGKGLRAFMLELSAKARARMFFPYGFFFREEMLFGNGKLTLSEVHF